MVIPVSNGVHTREDIWSLPRWDPTLLWYAKAVGALWPRPIKDPNSWRYQAAIHGYGPMDTTDGPFPDPLAQPGEALPADKATYWHQCQHGTWYFLPWHRGYLGYFERLVRATIVALGGPADWALPFWNYSDPANPNARHMRPEFLEPTLPDGSPNALFTHIKRGPHKMVASPYGQAGDFRITAKKASLACLAQHHFSDHPAAPSFGGVASGFMHEGGGMGVLEAVPHGAIHNAVGGATGWMSSFDTAALDPIFWIHHSNIDRLWAVWLAQTTPARSDPTDPAWLSPAGQGMPFHLHDETGQPVTFKPADVVDTRSALFAYQYQGGPAPAAPALAAPTPVAAMTQPAGPTLVAASDTNIDLAAQQSIPVRFEARGPALTLRGEATARHAYLNFEGVTGSGPLVAHEVFLDLPPGADPAASDPHYAGLLPMFGVREASRRGDPHGAGGVSYVLDVTAVIAHLKALGTWDEKTTTVRLVPEEPLPAGSSLKVGRVSLYYR